jgi:5-keto 4-deoxyuronate isomerase
MWDRTRASGAVDLLQIGDELRIDAPVAFAIALGGSATVSVDDEEHVLGEQDALQLDGGGLLTVLDGEVYLATIS